MTPSPRAAGSGRTVLLSDTFTGMQVNVNPSIFCRDIWENAFKNSTYKDYCLAKQLDSLHWPRVSSQATQTTFTVKTACLYLLTAVTGMTTTVRTKEDTSANGEVRYVALMVALADRKFRQYSECCYMPVTLNSCFFFQETHPSLLHLMMVVTSHCLTWFPSL